VRVAFAGTPEFALPALTALRAHHEIVGVLTQPDRPSGRGRRLTASAVKRAALELGLPLAQPETLAGDAARVLLGGWRPQLLVVVAYGLRLPRAVLELPPFGCLNLHASLLPRWRGAAPIERALLAGDVRTGITIMQMDAGLDTGPILLQRPIDISPQDTGGTLRAKVAALGAEALLKALEGLAAGGLRAVEQPSGGVTHAPRIDKTEARIDWSREAVEIDRQVRAFNPSPVAETVLEGEPLRVFAGHVVGPQTSDASSANVREKSPENCDPGAIVVGTIVRLSGGEMVVQCGRGLLAVTQVQRPGRRMLGVRDFAHGRALAGRRLG
jgi:methionyl-tRNA formyltransferase